MAASTDEAWTDLTSVSVAEWFWPPRLEATAVIEPEPGGRWELHSDVADMAVVGVIVAIHKARSLEIDWRWAGEESVTQVRLRLSPVGEQVTDVSVTHGGFSSDRDRDAHVEGWTDCLQRLVARHEQTR